MNKFFLNRRKYLSYSLAIFFSIFSKKILGNGNPYRDRFQSYRQTFRIEPNKEEANRIIKNIIKERQLITDLLVLTVPDTVEDGNVVPVEFKVNCTMNKNDYPLKVHILGMENPFPEIAIYEFYPNSGKPEVSFRCRMRKSSYLIAIVEMSDGRVALEKKYVDVMLGACS